MRKEIKDECLLLRLSKHMWMFEICFKERGSDTVPLLVPFPIIILILTRIHDADDDYSNDGNV